MHMVLYAPPRVRRELNMNLHDMRGTCGILACILIACSTSIGARAEDCETRQPEAHAVPKQSPAKNVAQVHDAVRFYRTPNRKDYFDIDLTVKTTFGYAFAAEKIRFTIPKPKPTVTGKFQRLLTAAERAALSDPKGYVHELFRIVKKIDAAVAKRRGLDPDKCLADCITYIVFIELRPVGVDVSTGDLIERGLGEIEHQIDQPNPWPFDIGKVLLSPIEKKAREVLPDIRGRIEAAPVAGIANALFTVCADGQIRYQPLAAESYNVLCGHEMQGLSSDAPRSETLRDAPAPKPPR